MEQFNSRQGFGITGLMHSIEKAREAGDYITPRDCIVLVTTNEEGELHCNSTRVIDVDPPDTVSMSNAETEGHRQVENLMLFFRKYIDGFENCTLNYIAPFFGIRETRRVVGLKTLNDETVRNCLVPEDSVCLAGYNFDIHVPGSLKTNIQPVEKAVGIPYGCLVSENIDGILASGRTICATDEGYGLSRIMGTCMAVGEAAAMCRRLGVMPRGIWTGGHARELQRLIGGDFPGNPDPAYAGWRIVDDEDDGVKFYGAWREEFCCCGGQVGDKVHEPTKKAEKAVYPLPVEKPGRYRLMGRTNYCWYAKEDSETAIAVVSDNRRISLKWNQAVNSGEWNEIGVLDLVPGSTLEIDVKSSRGTVVADAFAIVDTARD